MFYIAHFIFIIFLQREFLIKLISLNNENKKVKQPLLSGWIQ